MNIQGKCQIKDGPCEGGFPPEDMTGESNCEEGLDCCINTDQCAKIPFNMGKCQPDECPEDAVFGFQAGCPNNGYCCISFGGGGGGNNGGGSTEPGNPGQD
ncbi:MAG: hypothetical protein GY854_04165 [Deltaproteobacteria bacterium]|nr:hypothetical protein [Deltaproteobacteria bacterium]